MTILIEGEVVSVWQVDRLVPCTVVSFYQFNGNTLVRLEGISDRKVYIRLLSAFIKPDRFITLSKGERPQ